jgi:alanyl-tRNA synthetase
MLRGVKAAEIRSQFLRFFEARGHRVVASSSLVPADDPTLMFANAGMVPFKRLFLGEEKRDYQRAASSQKCMRVSGKHNDLEDVGRSLKHHTFFEMLGNFSFGDYFKAEAIEWAWELLTTVYRLDPDQLVVSVLHDDDEAYALWRDRVGLPERRIFRLPESENFWQMGDTGPCGPCSEIHFILDRAAFLGGADPSQDGFIEIYNLVFMQFEQAAGGKRRPLPKPSVDTGMGLERLTSILQGTQSNYDTDLFRPLIEWIEDASGVRYGARPEHDVSMRVTADHARACTFLVGDGVLPASEGRGYVARRVLRRAARHGVLLGVEEPFLFEMAGRVIDLMGDAYPELRERRAFIADTIRREEERFLRTLGRGLALLDEEVARAKRERRARLAGDIVFRLYDTYGFPIDLTEDILRGHALDYDRDSFAERMREQAELSRAGWKGSGGSAPPEVWSALANEIGESRFVGYETLVAEARVGALVRDGVRASEVTEGDRVELVAELTPFYAEAGGQVGDRGEIETPGGRIEVEDTQRPVEGLHVHRGRVVMGRVRVGEPATLRVDAAARAATVRNHSGTHLLHWALRDVLGAQVQQAGSLVSPERLRFDFTFDRPLAPGEIRQIEDRVNSLILENRPARVEQKSYREALDAGAIAIFEEKYGDRVRVVSFGPSTELCGGTHARATGEIGWLRVVSQSAIGAGLRRLEAQTGQGAVEHARRESEQLARAAELLRVSPQELADRIERLLAQRRELENELEQTRARLRRGGSQDPLHSAREVNGLRVIATEVEGASPKELRSMIDELKQRMGSGVVLLAARSDQKAALAMGVTRDLCTRVNAGEILRELAEAVQGSGGGRADFAQAGGSDPAGIPQAFERLWDRLSSL